MDNPPRTIGAVRHPLPDTPPTMPSHPSRLPWTSQETHNQRGTYAAHTITPTRDPTPSVVKIATHRCSHKLAAEGRHHENGIHAATPLRLDRKEGRTIRYLACLHAEVVEEGLDHGPGYGECARVCPE